MKKTKNKFPLILLLFTFCAFSCSEFLQVDPPNSKINNKLVFTTDEAANAAVAGMYSRMVGGNGGFMTGSNSLSILCGLYADELTNHSNLSESKIEFYNNNVKATSITIHNLWGELYSYIYTSNAIIEGLSSSTSISEPLKKQLTGEALFMRAFCHFYLVNLYGDIPKITTTDVKTNSLIAKSPIHEIYSLIIDDLSTAKELLFNTYIDSQKHRVNKAVATALLSRVYLYDRNWAEAEIEASKLIENTNYLIEPNLLDVFVRSSKETIWQMQSISPYYDTYDANEFIPNTVLKSTTLSFPLVQSIPTTDLRKSNWIGQFVLMANTYYYPHKYKVRLKSVANAPAIEELVVLRLAEQYLIRSEARTYLNKIEEAKEDLNKIRNRAGLVNTIADSQASLLLAIEEERKIEFFTEWAHRWFDLKRTNRANAILGLLKQNWNSDALNLPVPQTETQNNQKL